MNPRGQWIFICEPRCIYIL